jgi:hypothetical protein
MESCDFYHFFFGGIYIIISTRVKEEATLDLKCCKEQCLKEVLNMKILCYQDTVEERGIALILQ